VHQVLECYKDEPSLSLFFLSFYEPARAELITWILILCVKERAREFQNVLAEEKGEIP